MLVHKLFVVRSGTSRFSATMYYSLFGGKFCYNRNISVTLSTPIWFSCLWMFIVFLLLSHVVSWVRFGTWLYRFLIFAVFLIFKQMYSKNWLLCGFPYDALILRSFDTLNKRKFSFLRNIHYLNLIKIPMVVPGWQAGIYIVREHS